MSFGPESIMDEVRKAFGGTAYPGDNQLTVYDSGGRQYDETFHCLRGKKWQDMPVKEFLSGDTPIPDLTAEAFHYFLPALLIASLGDDTEAVNISSTLRFYLSPSSAYSVNEFVYDDTERFGHKMKLFTPAQRSAIIRVLQEYAVRGWATQDEIEDAVRSLQH